MARFFDVCALLVSELLLFFPKKDEEKIFVFAAAVPLPTPNYLELMGTN